MKILRTLILVLISSHFLINISYGQEKPQKVYSIIKEIRPFEWYKQQSELWKKELDKNSKNDDAWIYYYTANRMARMSNSEKYESLLGKSFEKPSDIVAIIKNKYSDSYAYYYISAYDSGIIDKSYFEFISQAYQMAPDRPDTYDELVTWYETRGKTDKRAEINKKWYRSGDVSPGILNWNYNTLVSLDSNAVLITNGDNDTYPLWILQDALNVREDVIVININLISIKDYREKIFKKAGIKEFKKNMSDIKDTDNPGLAYGKAFCSHIIKNCKKKPLYMALTLYNHYYSDYEKSMFLIGAAFKYSLNDFDNLALIKKNFERNFLLDYLTIDLNNDKSYTVVNQINMSYLPILLKLYEHYTLSEEINKANKVKKLALRIAFKNGKTDEVMPWFDKKFH